MHGQRNVKIHQNYCHRFDTMTKPQHKQTKGFSSVAMGARYESHSLTKMPQNVKHVPDSLISAETNLCSSTICYRP